MAQPAPDWQIIRPAWLIDGRGGPAQANQAVVIRGERVAWVGPRERARDAVGLVGDTQATELDFPNGALLPGLIDCHTHTNMPGDGRRGEAVNQDSDAIRLLRATRNVAIAQASGVTTLCDCGSWNRTGLDLREGLAQGVVNGPRVLVSGRPITVTGGHLWFMGGEADGPEGVRRLARQLLNEGVDFIKVAASGGSTATSDPFRPSLTTPEIRAVADEAHNRGKAVFAHCRCIAAVNNALDAGVDMVIHCAFYEPGGVYRFDQDAAERLARSGVWVNPTLHIGRTRLLQLRQKQAQGELEAAEVPILANLEQLELHRLAQFSRLAQLGVKLIGGSDCGWGTYPFGDYQGELIALADVGLAPAQAIKAGTLRAAQAIGLDAQIGSVEAGKLADLLLTEGDPTQDIKALRRVAAVFQSGRRVR